MLVASQTMQTDLPAPKPRVRNLPDYQRRYPWAELLRRVFLEDVLQCECGARRKLIAVITDPPVVTAILKSLGLPTAPPTVCDARAPPAPEREHTSEEETPPRASQPNGTIRSPASSPHAEKNVRPDRLHHSASRSS